MIQKFKNISSVYNKAICLFCVDLAIELRAVLEQTQIYITNFSSVVMFKTCHLGTVHYLSLIWFNHILVKAVKIIILQKSVIVYTNTCLRFRYLFTLLSLFNLRQYLTLNFESNE